ncbi:protein of unknown function [endosymbiont DhMRE of Dentiscutata heterogama]|uniref:hypothetical protein n=1 Tax=endosymbiont DhMRE of Dentiscutata heterogama TaxID=1609546 RepID=UPI000629D91B|nr:hypothetical protein [endosymbiont DhMRE of Dentiscutata heterogama]CFW92937.1 protein of unknown function [endosymbiont DhMRE of Dentiscutata heterogama]
MAENITLEQKEKNRQYILNNLDKYTIDVNGDFFNVDPNILGEEYDYINRNALTWKAVEEIKKKMTEMIIKNIKDWELVLFDTGPSAYPKLFKNKETGLIINKRRLGYDNDYYLIGEFGYRLYDWKDYDKKKQAREKKWKEWKQNNSSLPNQNNNQYSNPETEQKKQESQNPTSKEPQNPTPPNQNNNNPDQSNPTPNQEPEQQEQSTNNPLPSPETIQENYNNDKDKSTIENNSNSTTPEQKEQSEALLKLVIEAEFLIKDNQFNPDTLSQLLKEKEQNTEAYQLLKERMEQAINELSSLEQQNNNNESNEPSTNNTPQILTIVGVIGLMVMVSVVVIRKIRNKKIKTK